MLHFGSDISKSSTPENKIASSVDRREFIEVDLESDPSSAQDSVSSLHRGRTRSLMMSRDFSLKDDTPVTKTPAPFTDKPSRIPKRPTASLRGSRISRSASGIYQLEDSKLPRHCSDTHLKEKPIPERLKIMGERMQHLHRRMDRWASSLRHGSKRLSQKLERLHQHVDFALRDPSRTASRKAPALIEQYLPNDENDSAASVASSCIHEAQGTNTVESASQGSFGKYSSLFDSLNAAIHSLSGFNDSILTASFLYGLELSGVQKQNNGQIKSWLRSHLNAVRHPSPPAECETLSGVANLGTAAEMTKSTFRPPSSPPVTLSQWQLDRMNNQVHEDTFQQENSRKQLSNVQSLNPFSSHGTEDEKSPRSTEATVHCSPLTRETERATICAPYLKDRSCEISEKESPHETACNAADSDIPLEAIKPEFMHSPLSHLEAVSNKTSFHHPSLQHGPDDCLKNSQCFPSTDTRMHQMTMGGVIGAQTKLDVVHIDGAQTSVQNPVYDCIHHEIWIDCDEYLECHMPNSSPNLVYGFEDFEDNLGTTRPFSHCEMEELKTKWISVNDFV